MAEALNVQVRETRGKRESRRMRRTGQVPAVLYGHGEESVSLTLSADELVSVVRHGGRVVELKGALGEKALIRELQWDTYGLYVLHVDLTRVSEHERVTVTVPVELRGDAPGVREGGIVEHVTHEVEVECEALNIPEKIEVRVKDLHLGDELKAEKLTLPAGVTLVSDPHAVIVHCVKPALEEELEGGESEAAEPEVIGRKAEEDAADE